MAATLRGFSPSGPVIGNPSVELENAYLCVYTRRYVNPAPGFSDYLRRNHPNWFVLCGGLGKIGDAAERAAMLKDFFVQDGIPSYIRYRALRAADTAPESADVVKREYCAQLDELAQRQYDKDFGKLLVDYYKMGVSSLRRRHQRSHRGCAEVSIGKRRQRKKRCSDDRGAETHGSPERCLHARKASSGSTETGCYNGCK